MGKSSRAYRFREVKGQRRELLISAEKQIDGLDKHEAAVQAALARAAAAPPVPVVLKGAAARAAAAAMDVDAQEPPSGGAKGTKEEDGAARMRRVLAVTAFPAFKKRGGSKGVGGGLPTHPDPQKLRKLKKALKRGADI